MRHHLIAIIALPFLLQGCASISIVPPADVPADPQNSPRVEERSNWRPYSSGPMQTSSSRRAGEPWSGARGTKDETVTRSAIPEVVTTSVPTETVDGKPVPPAATSPLPAKAPDVRVEASSPPRPATSGAPVPSVFGSGVVSAWAAGYVPESHRTEFAIFARKAVADGQALMTMPTGEVYSASVTRRNGACSTVEVGVTADGNLPVVARGLVQVCG